MDEANVNGEGGGGVAKEKGECVDGGGGGEGVRKAKEGEAGGGGLGGGAVSAPPNVKPTRGSKE